MTAVCVAVYSQDWHLEVDMHKGAAKVHSHYFSALQAFWPALEVTVPAAIYAILKIAFLTMSHHDWLRGLQVLSGHVQEAVRGFRAMSELWYKHRALPDLYDRRRGGVVGFARDYPLRPEMVSQCKESVQGKGWGGSINS